MRNLKTDFNADKAVFGFPFFRFFFSFLFFFFQMGDPLVKKIKGLSLKVKPFRNIATYKQIWGAPSSPLPPTSTCTQCKSMNLRIRPRVKSYVTDFMCDAL